MAKTPIMQAAEIAEATHGEKGCINSQLLLSKEGQTKEPPPPQTLVQPCTYSSAEPPVA
jgi:hypothetical protein